MKKVISFILCVLMSAGMVGALTGCAKPFEREAFELIEKDTVGELKIGVKNEPTELAIMQAFVESFELEYPNIEVTVEPMQANNYRETLSQYYQADLASPGSMPDIISFGTEIFEYMDDKQEVAMNLQEFVDKTVEAELLNLADYYENIWSVGKKDGTGDMFMIPRSYDHVVAYYNKRIFKQAAEHLGMSEDDIMPFNGWTWDDFLERMGYIRQFYNETNKSNLYLIDANLEWEAVYNPIYESCGVQYFDESGNVALDSQETRDALNIMNDLVVRKIVGPFGGSSSNANFEGGQGCMMFHTIATKSRWYGKHGSDLDVATFPLIGDNPVVGAGAVGYTIYGRSMNSNIAWAFLVHMLSKDGQNAASATGNIVPIRKDLAGIDQEWAKYPAGSELNQEAFIYNSKYDKVTSYMREVDPKFSYLIMDQVKIIATNAFSVSEPLGVDAAIAKCVSEMTSILSDPY